VSSTIHIHVIYVSCSAFSAMIMGASMSSLAMASSSSPQQHAKQAFPQMYLKRSFPVIGTYPRMTKAVNSARYSAVGVGVNSESYGTLPSLG